MNKEIVTCTHGKFGEELVHSAEMIVGPMKNIKVFSLLPAVDPFTYRSQVEQYISSKPETGFLCMTDLYGGTPSNVLASLIPLGNIHVITGLNLAMLIEVYSQLDYKEIKDLADCALKILKLSGYNVNEELTKMMKKKEG